MATWWNLHDAGGNPSDKNALKKVFHIRYKLTLLLSNNVSEWRIRYENNVYDKEMRSFYFAPEAAKMSAHSSGSKWECIYSYKAQEEWGDIYHRILHEIEQQNQHKSNQVDKFCSWKQPRLGVGIVSFPVPTTPYSVWYEGEFVFLSLKVTHHSDLIDGTL